jgi:integrase/recombinase XerD
MPVGCWTRYLLNYAPVRETTDMRRRYSLSYRDWPEADGRAWEAALTAGDVFDDGGVATPWRTSTRTDAITGYGYWLKFVVDQDPALLELNPAERATPARLRAYLQTLLSRMSAMGAATALGHLVLALRAIAPDYDRTRLHALHNAVQRMARPRDKRAKLVSAERLVGLGRQLMRQAERDGVVEGLRAYRDGLLIALLAARPLRLGNLAGLRLDRHVEIHGDHVALNLSGDETKNAQPIECWLPDDLVPFFKRYLHEVRPRFYGVDGHRGLWPSSKGKPLTAPGIFQIVTRRTKAALGRAISPHLFRDIAATTFALARPEQALLARDLLDHSDFRMTERHYLHAQTAEAGRFYANEIDNLRRALKNRPRVGDDRRAEDPRT